MNTIVTQSRLFVKCNYYYVIKSVQYSICLLHSFISLNNLNLSGILSPLNCICGAMCTTFRIILLNLPNAR
jgi:hypothetical protein